MGQGSKEDNQAWRQSGLLRPLYRRLACLGRVPGWGQPHAVGSLPALQCVGGISWATLYGLGGYFPGNTVYRLTGPIGPITIAPGLLVTIVSLDFVRRNERRPEEEAEQAFSGALDAFSPVSSGAKDQGQDDVLNALPPYGPDDELQQEVERILFDLTSLHIDLNSGRDRREEKEGVMPAEREYKMG